MPPWSKRLDPWLPALVLLAMAVACIGRWSLWNDEIFTWQVAQAPLGKVVDTMAHDVHPPLYFLLVTAWAHLCPDQDELLRLPSLLMGVAAVGIVWRATTRYFDAEVGRFATWAVALAPVVMAMSVSARPYAQLLLIGACAMWAGLAVVFGERPARAALGLAVVTSAGLYTHYGSAAVLAGIAIGGTLAAFARTELTLRDRTTRFVWLALAMGVGGATFVPWVSTLQAQMKIAGVEPQERSLDILRFTEWATSAYSPWISKLLVALQLAGLGLVIWRHRAKDLFLFGVVVAAFAVSWQLSATPRSDRARNFIDLLPAGAMLAGIAANRIAGRFAPLVLMVVAAPECWRILSRPVSPQNGDTWHDLQVDADVFDAALPPDGMLVGRPFALQLQYFRYAPALAARSKPKETPLSTTAWLYSSGKPPVVEGDAAVYHEKCTFRRAFDWVMYVPDGPSCDAMHFWIRTIAEQDGNVSYLLELAGRELAEKDIDSAEKHARRAAERLHGRPDAWELVAAVAEARGQHDVALDALNRAFDEATAWRRDGGTIARVAKSRARVRGALGKPTAADLAIIECTRTHKHPYRCGSVWEVLP